MPKTASRPQVGRSPDPTGRRTNAEVSRCRLDLVCDRTTEGLRLRPIRRDGATCPTLCCEACAVAATTAGGPS
ncbi:hypothetical protein [Micromonospora sp. WMMD737]|uniref:hypothetical protein n=1 Tax=Micromonospora sp. WMMD737 TaxID=3404113 RepID=UPI003B957C90